MVKVIATDYDGTFRRNNEIDPEEVRIIEKWRASGHYFGFVTGRGWDFLDNFRKYELHDAGVIADFLVIENGAVVCDMDGNLWSRTYFDRDMYSTLEQYFRSKPYVQDCPHVGTAEQYEAFYCTMDSPMVALQYAEELNSMYGDKIHAVVNYWHINIMSAGTSKAFGIQKVLEHYGLPFDAVAAVGDDFNDLDMLKAYDGWAVDSAKGIIKAQVSHTIPSVGDLALRFMKEE